MLRTNLFHAFSASLQRQFAHAQSPQVKWCSSSSFGQKNAPARSVTLPVMLIFKGRQGHFAPFGLLSQSCHVFCLSRHPHLWLLCPASSVVSNPSNQGIAHSACSPSPHIFVLACEPHSAAGLSWFLFRAHAFQPAKPSLKHLCLHTKTKTHASPLRKRSCPPPSFFGLCVHHLVRSRSWRAAQCPQ